MNRKEAAELSPIIQAFSEGKPIQYRIKDNESAVWTNVDRNYHNFSPHSFQYRIKSGPIYRPFNNTKECMTEMMKHQPIGWLKSREATEDVYFPITGLTNDTCGVKLGPSSGGWSFSGLLDYYTFVDGTPFGVKEEK